MNNRWCPLRTVPLCLPSLLKEFQIISGQHVSLGVLSWEVLYKTSFWSIMLPWFCTYHIASQNIVCIFFSPVVFGVKIFHTAISCCLSITFYFRISFEYVFIKLKLAVNLVWWILNLNISLVLHLDC